MAIQFIKNGHEIGQTSCYRSLNILAHAQMEEIDLGSRCGGHGVCLNDRIQVNSNAEKWSPITDIEKKAFTEEQLAAGYRLACQVWPQMDHLDLYVTTSIATFIEDRV